MSGSAGDAAADAQVVAPDGGTVSGQVRVYDDATFRTSIAFSGRGNIGYEVGGQSLVSGFSSPSYTLPGVPDTGLLWVSLSPTTTTVSVAPTLERVDLATRPLDLTFVNKDVFFSTLELTAGLGPAKPGAAQVVLLFVDANGTRVSNVAVTAPSGVTVAYDAGPGVFDGTPGTATATQTGGTVLLYDVPTTRAWPGEDIAVAYRAPSGTGTVTVRVASDAVSVLTQRL